MKLKIPTEVYTGFGILHLSQDLAVESKQRRGIPSKVTRDLIQKDPSRGRSGTKSIDFTENPFDVEISGNEDEIEDWLTEGFLDLIDLEPFPKPNPTPIPTPPPRPDPSPCDSIESEFQRLISELRQQRLLASDLEQLISGLDGTANPIIVIFVALFKSGLDSIQEEIDRLQEAIASVTAAAEMNNCDLSPPLVILRPRRG